MEFTLQGNAPEEPKKPEPQFNLEKVEEASQQLLPKYLQEEYDNLSKDEKELLYEICRNENIFSDEFRHLQAFLFKSPPPSPTEFIDPKNGWLSKDYTDSLFQWVKDDFIELCSGKKTYTHVVEYGSTRIGKSHFSVLLILYSIVWMHHLRDVAKFYNKSVGTALSIYILSFQYDKVYQLYLKPLYNLMESSPRFIQVKFTDQVKKDQAKYGCDKIVWSKAALVGHISLASGLQIVSGNDDALAIIGQNIVAALISEVTYFIEKAGATEESIFKLYTDCAERIKATVGRATGSFIVLDSSANLAESQIENHILKKLANREDVLFRWRRRWEVEELLDQNFPKWKRTKKTFTVCTGDGTYPPRIIFDKAELKDIPSNLIIEVPIDALQEFEDNLIPSIKNIAGCPTVSESKFIPNKRLIDSMWSPGIDNIEGILIADSAVQPQRYLWTQICDRFFTKYNGTDFKIKRAPQEPRWIHIDTAYSSKGDVVGITMLHKEWSQELRDTVFVVDFSFCIGPGENGISLESLSWLIHDLTFIGQILIANVTMDTFQTQNMIQFLQRSNIPCEKLSVDTTIEPYLFLYSCLLIGNIKSGRNIFLKNNLLSLYRKKSKTGREKIDHTSGVTYNKYSGDFDKSKCGENAKDCSDSLAGALFASQLSKHVPMTSHERENQRFNTNLSIDIHSRTPVFSKQVQDVYKNLHKIY
jgi:hypothetical protein